MPEKRTALLVRYRHRAGRLSKLMSVSLAEAETVLLNAPVTRRLCPQQTLEGYRKADSRERRIYYRRCSRSFGHRLETLSAQQRALLLRRCRDGLSWKKACRETGYSQSGAMKVFRCVGHGAEIKKEGRKAPYRHGP